jgi:hypothetical protein
LDQESISAQEIDKMLQQWQQGDTLEFPELPFIYVADASLPLTTASMSQAQDEQPEPSDGSLLDVIAIEAKHFVVLSKTCDIVKDIKSVPMLLLAPLVIVDKPTLENAQKGSSSSYLFIPAMKGDRMVGDLNQIMTVEKSILFNKRCKQKTSVKLDSEQRVMGDAIARKFKRFAFPEDYNLALKLLTNRVTKKHDKDSPEGAHYRNITEIRVVTADAWSSETISTEMLFLVDDEKLIDRKLNECIAQLVKLFKLGGRFQTLPQFRCISYKNIDADTYIRSFPLDLEYLSK